MGVCECHECTQSRRNPIEKGLSEQSSDMRLMNIQSQLSQIDGFLKGLVEGLNMRLDHIEKQLKQIN